jgi:hypothetical protein
LQSESGAIAVPPTNDAAWFERARGRFRLDVADHLRMAAGKMGLAATVTPDHERAVREFDDGTLSRVIAAFEMPEMANPAPTR